jgi:hypothetical protein
MTKVKRFEDLICWQKARSPTNAIFGLTRRPDFSKDFRLRDQILDGAGSVIHNIAEISGDQAKYLSDDSNSDLPDDYQTNDYMTIDYKTGD